jgi:SAM-dependent methyltransferase
MLTIERYERLSMAQRPFSNEHCSMPFDAIGWHNRRAWDREVENENPATIPVGPEEIARARGGRPFLTLTGNKPLPQSWLQDSFGVPTLCLACGGGQQAPIIAAAGGLVTSFDNSPRQLERDRALADAHGLTVSCVLGDMRDLCVFQDGSFDFVMFGLASQFVPDPKPVWQEIARVLRPKGRLVAAIVNPISYILDWSGYQQGMMNVRHSLPYSDIGSLSEDERSRLFKADDPIEFGHTMEQQLSGITASGMCIDGFFEDFALNEPSARFFATYFLLRGCKNTNDA